jgi:hypothetical protein
VPIFTFPSVRLSPHSCPSCQCTDTQPLRDVSSASGRDLYPSLALHGPVTSE